MKFCQAQSVTVSTDLIAFYFRKNQGDRVTNANRRRPTMHTNPTAPANKQLEKVSAFVRTGGAPLKTIQRGST